MMDELEYRETRRCGYCGHYDGINQACWVVALDGLCRDVSENDYCVFSFKEE